MLQGEKRILVGLLACFELFALFQNLFATIYFVSQTFAPKYDADTAREYKQVISEFYV